MFKDSKVMGVIAFALIALVIGIVKPFTGLDPQGHFVMATVIAALGFWIFRPRGLPFAAVVRSYLPVALSLFRKSL